MFGNAYFGASYFGPTYYGPDGEPTSGGTTKDWRYKKGLTGEQLKELEEFGKAREGIKEPETIPEPAPETITPETQEEIYTDDLSEIKPPVPEITILKQEQFSLQEKLADEEDIGLILAIIESHEN
jgi:hypothetical protein